MTEPREPAVGLLLGVDGALGAMDFASVLQALRCSYELLDRTAHRVLGDRADGLRWHLAGLRGGSALTHVEARPTEDVTERELQEVVETYSADLRDPGERLPPEDMPVLRALLEELARTDSGALFLQRPDTPDATRVRLPPASVLPLLDVPARELHKVIGSVTGTLESLNVHAKREASLYNELDRRRVVVTFPESAYERVHAALRRRVEVFGVVQEDADGRPLRVRLQDIDVLTADEDLPPLSSLFGSQPDLTGDLKAEEYLRKNRRELGLG
jgi:hypothetical protein